MTDMIQKYFIGITSEELQFIREYVEKEKELYRAEKVVRCVQRLENRNRVILEVFALYIAISMLGFVVLAMYFEGGIF